MEYPELHRKIVDDLMDGRFILSRAPEYEIIKEKDDFYEDFFKISFGHDLEITADFVRLISEETDEHLSRDISIFFSILCHELDKQGKNFLDALQYSEFSMEEINTLFDNSSWIDLLLSNKQLKDSEARRRLIFTTMGKRNIVEKVNEDRFYFTAAHKVFIDYAKELGKNASNDKSGGTHE
jgi:hypothetical protein